MRPRDLQALEFDQVRRRLSEFAASPGGQAACLQLAPSTDRERAAAELDAVWQCFRTTESNGPLPLGEFPDVRASVRVAAHPGFMLDGRALVDVLAVLDTARRCRAYLRAHVPSDGALAALHARLVPPEELRATLARSLDHEGNVTDDASDELAQVRSTVRRVRAHLARRLEAMLERPNVAEQLSDKFVTLRNDRYVLPVRTAAVPRFEGVIQDRSVSGETTFIEPPFAVELNNQLLVAAREEERIVRRILTDLTDMLRGEAAAVETTYAALVELDVLHARATFSREYRCSQPVFDDEEIRLLGACHPVLSFSGREVIPVDILLPPGKRALVLTGPNTGGKTVALKTVGLLALMAQAGIPIPALEGSRLPCFRTVFADVGDEQSIERDLSTFSGHLANIREILAGHEAPALVVLDEPGVGTDPEEGAALGIGVIDELVQCGARVVLTTHYAAIKAHALGHDAFVTASVSFDTERMLPSYRLAYHSVGESLAVPIARRLGLPERILAAADHARSNEARAFSAAMQRLEESRRRYEQRLAELEDSLRRAQQQEAETAALLAELRDKRSRHWKDELRAARAFVNTVREEGRALLAAIETGAAQRRDLQRFAQEKAAAIEARGEEAAGDERESGEPVGPLAVGDDVLVAGTQLRGELVELGPERAWIQRGTMRFEVPARGLRKAAAGRATGATSVRVQVDRPEQASGIEISLIGLRVREALARLDDYLDRAARDGVPSVRIIHGLGSGALRRAVGEYLEGCPYCSGYRGGEDAEGGAGVTIATLGG